MGERCASHKKLCNVLFLSCDIFTILIAIPNTFLLQSKSPSLWLCYMKAYWKMFIYGGILKLLGDLAALVGPISIAYVVQYIERNLSASSSSSSSASLLSTTVQPQPLLFGQNDAQLSSTINGTDALIAAPITHSDLTAASEIGSSSNYYLPLSAAPIEYRMTAGSLIVSPWLINDGTEIYYPNWTEFVENGWIMGLLVLLATLAQGSFSQASTHIVNIIGIRLRTSLQCLVYRKTLLISSCCFMAGSTTPAAAEQASPPPSPSSPEPQQQQPNEHQTEGTANANGIFLNDNKNSNGSISIDAHETFYTNNAADDNNDTTPDELGDGMHALDDQTKVDSSTMDDKTAPQQKHEQDQEQRPQQQQKQKHEHEQTAIDTGTITNLMSEDALNIMSFFWIAHYVWAIPLKVCTQFQLFYFFPLHIGVCDTVPTLSHSNSRSL